MRTFTNFIALSLAVATCWGTGAFAQGECCKSTKAPTEKGGCSACEVKSGPSHDKAPESGSEHGALGREGGHGKGHMAVMQGAHMLIGNNSSIAREVIEVPGGVKTVNTTSDPDLVAVLQKHPREMSGHLQGGGHVRKWDPVFSELAKHHDKVTMKYTNLPNGIEVLSTSSDPEVTKLIRAHAKKVSDFVKRGMASMHEPTPLPDGYKAPDAEPRGPHHKH